MPSGEEVNSIRPMSPVSPEQAANLGAQRRVESAVDSIRQENARAVNQVERAQGQSRTARFTKKKETPGCIVFSEAPEEGQPEIIGTLYCKRWFAGSAQSITVTVTKG